MVATTNAIAKIAAVVAGLGLVATSFAAFAAPVKAATADELQAQITALLAQISALQGGSASASATFTMDLTLGSSGAEVTALQNWLISKGYSIPAGATGYFGAQTQSALAAWQAANGVTPAAGYFGPITREKVNAMAGGTTGGSTGGSTGGDLSGGESSLEDLQARDGADDEVELGGSAEVAEFEVDVEDADIELQRLDLTFDSSAVETGDDDEPWDVFGEVTVMVDGEEVASEDVSDEDDWLDNDGTSGEYVFRFTGLDAVVEEGNSAIITVTVEAQGGADIDAVTANLAVWEMYIDTDGLRGTDGEGIEQYIGDDSENVTFDVVEEGADDGLDIRRSDSDPDSTTLQVEADSRSEWYTIFAYDLEADEDGGDIELNTVPVTLVTSDSAIQTVINDVKLVIDGEEFDDFDWGGLNTTTGSTTFDIDGDVVIEAGESVTVEYMVEFKALTGNYSAGTTIAASTTGAGYDAEGADDVTVDGSASGDTHTLQVAGIDVETNDGDNYTADATEVESLPDYAEFEVVVDISAFDEDVFISATSSAFTYQIEDSAGAATTSAGTFSATVSSDADVDSGNYVIDEDSMEEFTFKVTFTPAANAGGYDFRMQLLTISFGTVNDTATANNTTFSASPASDYETDFVFIAD